MTEFAAIAAILLSIAAVLLLISAVLITTWREGSLQADLKWVRQYFRITLARKTTINN